MNIYKDLTKLWVGGTIKVVFKEGVLAMGLPIVKRIASFLVVMALIAVPFFNAGAAVMAAGTPSTMEQAEVEILSVKQNGTELNYLEPENEWSSGEYEVPDYKAKVVVAAKFSGLTVGHKYYVGDYETAEGFVADSTEITKETEYSVSLTSEYTNASVNIMDDSKRSIGYANVSLKTIDPSIKYPSYVFLDKVTQKDKELIIEKGTNDWGMSSLYMEGNTVQDVTLTVRVNDALDTEQYAVYASWGPGPSSERKTMTGAQLKTGVDLSFNSGKYEDGFYDVVSVWIMGVGQNYGGNSMNFYYDGERYYEAHLNTVVDENIGDFAVGLSYANHPDKVIDVEYAEINPNFFGDDSPLKLKITGKYYNDSQQYSVKTKVEKHTGAPMGGAPSVNEVYTKEFNATGKELKESKEVVLDGLTLDFMELNELLYDESMYTLSVEIDEVIRNIEMEYSYGDFRASIIYESGQQSAPGMAGAGICGGHICSLSTWGYKEVANGGAYLHYSAPDVPDDDTFGYKYYYGNQHPYYGVSLDTFTLLESGEISGKRLKAGMLHFETTNPENYSNPVYTVLITKDNKVISILSNGVFLWDGAGIKSQEIISDHNIYMQMWSFEYSIPKGAKTSLAVTGTGFEDNKNYLLTMELLAEPDENSSEKINDLVDTIVVKVTGKELNEGKAKIDFEYLGRDRVMGGISIAPESGGTGTNYVGTGIMVNYIDLNTVVNSQKGYSVDNAKAVIKNISKKTTANDFMDGVDLAESGSVKIYKSDGSEMTSGNVGTGMKLRTFDEFDRPTYDMDISIKGDVSGDGDISLTDLVKVKRHVAEVEALSGAYEVAGDVTGTGKISLTDLVKVARDVAELEEVK